MNFTTVKGDRDMTGDTLAIAANKGFNWKRYFFMALGVGLFWIVYASPPWPAAIDPLGESFPLTREAKGALAVFLLAGTWWVFEVVPIGVTSLAIGVLQALFLIRSAKTPSRISWTRR